MIRRLLLCAATALLVGCSTGSNPGLRDGVAESSEPVLASPAARTITYRTASFTDPTFDISPDGQRLYFAAMGEIYVVPVGGGSAAPLSLGAGWKTRPVISPDGQDVAFLSDSGSGIAAWRARLPVDRPTTGSLVPGFEASTLAWVDATSLGSVLVSTSGPAQLGVWVEYEKGLRSVSQRGRGGPHDPRAISRALTRGVPAAMSADGRGNVFLHLATGIVRIDASTGIEEVVVSAEDGSVSQPRVTPDGAWLGLAMTSDGATRLVLRDLASGKLRDTGCRLNSGPRSSVTYGINPEPSYAFIPGQQAVVLERDGVFHRCTFEGVETPIAVEADVAIRVAARVHPSAGRQYGALGPVLDLASTADGRIVAFSAAGRLWLLDRSDGQRRRVSTSDAQERMPAFSADGRHLAYVERFQDQSSALRMLDLETGASKVLLVSRNILANPAWSPDGRKIAFSEKPVTDRSDPVLKWLDRDGSGGVIGPSAASGPNQFPVLTWDSSNSALLYMQGTTLVAHRLGEEPQPLLSVDPTVWTVRVSPSRRFVALGTRDGVYVTPILLSSGDRPAFSWSDVRAMKRLWVGGADHIQWLADDSLIWTAQRKLMRASPGEAPREVVELDVPQGAVAEPDRRAYVGATVITMDRAGTIPDAVIVTRGRTLEYVGSRPGAPDLTGIETIDLTGKWIVPGFVDVHAHNLRTERSEYNLPVTQYDLAELGFGVTTVFDPSESSLVEAAVKWNASQGDDFLGPTVYGTGVAMLGSSEGSFLTLDLQSYEQALVLAKDLAARDAVMIKAYQQGTRQQRQWLARAARATGLGVTAHEDKSPSVMLPLIVDGYTAVEHEISEGALREDIKRFLIESRIPLTPTLVVAARDNGLTSESLDSDMRRDCLVDPARFGSRSDEPWDQARLLRSPVGQRMIDYADLLNRGAKVAIGGHGEAPGLDFHWELALLSIGGATPTDLLRAATINGAEKLGLESRIGSLAKGKDADFVVLNADPLADIRNARDIERVVRRGRVVSWPSGTAPQSWRSATSWEACQRWNFGLDRPGVSVSP